jgi:hypothetical protein
MRFLGGRSRLEEAMGRAFDCCVSCHEDEDMGYNICERDDGDDWISICCSVANEVPKEEVPWGKLREMWLERARSDGDEVLR